VKVGDEGFLEGVHYVSELVPIEIKRFSELGEVVVEVG
jgi:hypothetical protein